MKIRNIMAAMLAISLLFMLAACGGNNNAADSLVGKYAIADIKNDPDGTTLKELETMYKKDGLNLTDHLYLELFEGNGFVLVMFGETEMVGTYTLANGSLILTSGGDVQTASVSGNTITWEYENGAKLIFKIQASSFNWLWVLLIALAVVAIGGGTAFFIIRKKDKSRGKQA